MTELDFLLVIILLHKTVRGIIADANGYTVCLYGSAYLQNQDRPVTFYNCKLEVGDLATPLTESGATRPASSATQPTQPAASSNN